MGNGNLYTPILRQFIQSVQKGFGLLDKTSQAEVREFVKMQQHKNGGFTDRGGNPDLYYSLFGVWLSVGLDLTHVLEKHKSFISQADTMQNKAVDKSALILIQIVLFGDDYKRPSLFTVLKMFFQFGIQTNIWYRVFLFLLTFDALYGRKRVLYYFAHIWLQFYKPPNDAPCSIYSALMVMKSQVGLSVEKEISKLLSYFEEGRGFKAFQHLGTGDLLSTAVALFSLKFVNADLRVITPTFLELIQQNYESGAFLSGDGDLSRALEYTFYGLMALGTLS